MGSSGNQKVTIYNMLGYMGAWEWYDNQITLSQDTERTRKNNPVGSKGAATRVLNRMQGLETVTAKRGRWIKGIGRVDLEEGTDESSALLVGGESSLVK